MENDIVIVKNWFNSTTPNINIKLSFANNTPSTLYYVVSNDAGFSMQNNTGSINSSTAITTYPIIQIPTNTNRTYFNLLIQFYTDSNHTNLLYTYQYPINLYIIDLTTANIVAKWDFTDGTAQGWTGQTDLGNDGFADPYHLWFYATSSKNDYKFTSPSIALPRANKLFIIFVYKDDLASPGHSLYFRLEDETGAVIKVFVNQDPFQSGGWKIYYADITNFAGFIKNFTVHGSGSGYYAWGAHLDDVYIIAL